MFWQLFLSYVTLVGLALLSFTLVVFRQASRDGLNWLARDAVLVGVAVMALSVVPGLYLARRFVRPMRALTSGARRISGGDYGHTIHTGGVGENAELERAFNDMSEELARQFAQLEQDRQQLRAILGGMVEGVVACDPEQRVLFANERAGWFLDFATRDAIGRKFWEVVRHRQIHEVLDRADAGGEPYREEVDWNGPAVKSLAIYVARLPGEKSQGTIIVLHDTTKLRQLERVRQEFVANVSHELKTPLSVIKACIETLMDGAAEDVDSRNEFLEQIALQGDRLYALILDLLSLARIEGDNYELDLQAIPIGAAVEECIDRHRPRAEAKSLDLVVEPPDADLADRLNVWADDEAVGQILDNLIDNAVKYTPEGGTVRVRWSAQSDSSVCLQVQDSGIGIPERDLPRVFERFYRVDKGRSREVGGTGLGLAIVKHLAQALGGTIGAASTVGRGTTFTVTLPRARDA